MSKKKRRAQLAAAHTKASDASARFALASDGAQTTQEDARGSWWPWLALLIFLASAGALAWFTQNPNAAPVVASAVESALSAPIRPQNSCRRVPSFMAGLGFGAGASISTSERDVLGIAVVEFDPQSKRRIRLWQHPSWREAGQLSAFAFDRNGDIYAIPAPRVNLAENPPALQNRLYRIDANTGEMALALEFPVAAAANARNPFAGMGLNYDCDAHALWLSSVAGSTFAEQRGQVMRIALLPTPKATVVINAIDGFGIVRASSGAQSGLLLGAARSGALWWQALSPQGDAIGERSELLNIAGLGPLGNERIRKTEIGADGTLIVHGTGFQFNLAQPSAQRKATHYRFRWDSEAKRYQFVDWE